MKKQEMSANELLGLLSDAMQRNVDNVPPGFRTRSAWQAEWKCSSSHAKNLINAGLESGLMERRFFRIKTGRSVFPTPHYGPTKSGTKR